MYIQYVDRIQIAASSRIYALHVANAPDGARKFMVPVQTEVFAESGRGFMMVRDLLRAFIAGLPRRSGRFSCGGSPLDRRPQHQERFGAASSPDRG
jgi:hypothetical protein